MINLIYTLAFTQLLTAIGLIIQGIALLVLQRKIKRIKQDDNLKQAIRKYELEWGEWLNATGTKHTKTPTQDHG